MAEEITEIYYDIEASVSILNCLDSFDAKQVMSRDEEKQLKSDAVYVMRRAIRSLAESWETVKE